jgi:hypothetical protein
MRFLTGGRNYCVCARMRSLTTNHFVDGYVCWIAEAALAVPEEYMESFNDLQAQDTKPDAHEARDELKALLAYVYEVRRRVGGDQP